MLQNGEIDIITFTSSSTVKNFVQLVGRESVPEGVKIACIGPITAQTAEEHGLKPDIVAEEYTIEGLVQAIVDHRGTEDTRGKPMRGSRPVVLWTVLVVCLIAVAIVVVLVPWKRADVFQMPVLRSGGD